MRWKQQVLAPNNILLVIVVCFVNLAHLLAQAAVGAAAVGDTELICAIKVNPLSDCCNLGVN